MGSPLDNSESEKLHKKAETLRHAADSIDQLVGYYIRAHKSIDEIGPLNAQAREVRAQAGVVLRMARNAAIREGKVPHGH